MNEVYLMKGDVRLKSWKKLPTVPNVGDTVTISVYDYDKGCRVDTVYRVESRNITFDEQYGETSWILQVVEL